MSKPLLGTGSVTEMMLLLLLLYFYGAHVQARPRSHSFSRRVDQSGWVGAYSDAEFPVSLVVVITLAGLTSDDRAAEREGECGRDVGYLSSDDLLW